jgi:toluene monooxygenase system protein E
MAPASTISNCATYQTADSLRWLSHTAYRTKELSKSFSDIGLGIDERRYWEQDPAWQGLRELVEKALVAWDWGEAFVAFSLVIRPAVEETVLRALGQAGRHNGDMLLGMLTDAQLLDGERHRRWAGALVRFCIDSEGNRDVLRQWVAKWEPLADAAIDDYCSALPDAPGSAEKARVATRKFRESLGL